MKTQESFIKKVIIKKDLKEWVAIQRGGWVFRWNVASKNVQLEQKREGRPLDLFGGILGNQF